MPPTTDGADGVEEFLDWLVLERGRARRTREAYQRDLTDYCEVLADRGRSPETAEEDDLVAFLRRRQQRGMAPASVRRAMTAVRTFHQYLVMEGWRPDDPSAAVELPRVPVGVPKALSEAEMDAVIGAVEGTDRVARRDRAMLEVLYGTGMRISELIGMSLSDLDMGGRTVRVVGKGQKERVLPVGRCAHEALAAWLAPAGRGEMEPDRWASQHDQEAVWLSQRGRRLSRPGAWGVVKKRARQVGLGAKVTPHSFRHSCATHMLDHGADIRAVQELLGHASISTTQIYTMVSKEVLWEVYRAAHPRAVRSR
ncbi:site-specific tyrosine recombinase [Candidatus Poriferisocius sp.]|uniref:site-specific tyrosine recombinase n=1 Tax=Candidatus Poriferisocius sp. TaxID=3101276 RepID=UPI003B5B2A6F